MEDEYKKLNEVLEKDVKELEKIRELPNGNIVSIITEAFAKRVKMLILKSNYNIERPMKKEDVIKYVLKFYKSFDSDMYQKAKNIIINLLDSDILISIYNQKNPNVLLDDKDFPKQIGSSGLITRYDDLIINSSMETHKIQTKKGKLYQELLGNTQDIYVLAHEMAHCMNLNPDSMQYRYETGYILEEVNPRLIELFLHDFLIKEGITTEKEVLYRNANEFIENREMASINHLRIELAKEKEKRGDIKKEDLENVLKNNGYRVNDYIIRNNIKRLTKYKDEFNSKYVIADFLNPYIYNLCITHPEEAKDIYKNFLIGMREDNVEKVFNSIGLKLNQESLEKLINFKNSQRDELQEKINDFTLELER